MSRDSDLQVRTWEVGKKLELYIFTSRLRQVRKMPASSCLSLPRAMGLKVKAEPRLGRDDNYQTKYGVQINLDFKSTTDIFTSHEMYFY